MTHFSAAPTRRTVLRAAAWTAPAVTIAVAAPALACSPGTPCGTAGPLTIVRQGTVLRLTTTLTTDQALTGVSAVVTLSYVGANDTRVTSTTVSAPWATSGHGVASATFTAAALDRGDISFSPRINLDNTSFDSVSVSVTFTWAGNTQGVTTSGTYAKDASLP
ncbi:hypothetical protein [Nocardioides sp. Soil805]|uniref:hypothetical protein n=1 Tax=Nocardioides sp. Soil805 TaxID=1736416 RepID=UPI000702885D|nr:hypothetical protein [Nocardioides sp. Soil805]KRF35041.1 hypothetical protein ASG94_12985 [Nocardioides sp. Soil805]